MNESTYKLIINDVKNNVKDEKFQKVIIDNIDLLLKEIATKHNNEIERISNSYQHLQYKIETLLDVIDDMDDDIKNKILINAFNEL